MNYPKVEFKIDPKAEAKNIPKLLNLAGGGIFIPKIRKTFDKIFYPKIKQLHKGKQSKFKKIKRIYEKIWEDVGERYIKEIEKILGYRLNQNKTVYIVPSLWVNIAEVRGRKNAFIIAVEKQQSPLDYILLHELTHLYYTDFLVKRNLGEAGDSPLMEGVDHLILFKSPIINLFKGIKYEKVGFVKSNPKFMQELEKIWKKRKNFESFLKEAIKIQRRFKNIKIC